MPTWPASTTSPGSTFTTTTSAFIGAPTCRINVAFSQVVIICK